MAEGRRTTTWSLSRGRLFEECPRAYAYKHRLPPGTQRMRARRLGSLKSLPMACGCAVDLVVCHAMRRYRDAGEIKSGLGAAGERLMRRVVAESPRLCEETMRHGLPYSSALHPLVHDHYGLDVGRAAEERMVRRACDCLDAFERSEIWERLRALGASSWAPILGLDAAPLPTILARGGLTVYAPYDVCLRGDDGRVYVLDLKSGVRTEAAEESARDQLSLYGLWAARSYGVPLNLVRVQAVWLLDGPAPWCPEPVDRDRLGRVARRMLAQIEAEAAMFGGSETGTAPARPCARRCPMCCWREMCEEGQRECSHLVGVRSWGS